MVDTLLPESIEVPASMVYGDVQPAYRDTYIQLRGLAHQSHFKETLPMSFMQLEKLFGKSHQSIYEHVIWLRKNNWIEIKDAGQKTYIFSFPTSVSEKAEQNDALLINSSLNINPDQSNNKKLINGVSEFSENDNGIKHRDPLLSNQAVILYRGITHITANNIQRENIANTVNDLDLWKATITHWLGHGWSKMNVSGMLDSYKKGGKQGCTLCNRPNNGYKKQIDATNNPFYGKRWQDFFNRDDEVPKGAEL